MKGTEFVVKAVDKISTNVVLSIVKGSIGWKTRELAVQLLKQEPSHDLQTCATDLAEQIIVCMGKAKAVRFSQSGTLDMLSALTVLSCDKVLQESWFSAINSIFDSELDPKVCNNLGQHIIEQLVPAIARTSRACTEKTTTPLRPLPKEEKDTLYYVSGFVVHKLTKKYGRFSNNKTASVFVDILMSWLKTDIDVVPEHICHWIKRQDRGGLKHVKPQLFRVFEQIEIVFRSVVNTNTICKLRKENIVPLAVDSIKEDTTVQDLWRDLVKDQLSDSLSEALLEDVLKSWVQMRGRYVVEQFIFNSKMNNDEHKMARMGTAAFRKTLDK